MRRSTLLVCLPALVVLCCLAVMDRLTGSRRLWRAVVTGASAGLLAAVAYDVLRLPFVFANRLGIQRAVPALNLFKVFPEFGALIQGQPPDQVHYSLATQLIGWAYHFSNGLTFGIMYLALVGSAARRHWAWGILFAVALELGMLCTPYPAFFQIPLTAKFVAVTLGVHLAFGAVMGRTATAFETALTPPGRQEPGS